MYPLLGYMLHALPKDGILVPVQCPSTMGTNPIVWEYSRYCQRLTLINPWALEGRGTCRIKIDNWSKI